VRTIFGDNFDALVTDLPYGRATGEKDARELAERFMKFLPGLVRKGGYAVVASHFDDLKMPAEMELETKCEIYLHKALSKFVYVLKA